METSASNTTPTEPAAKVSAVTTLVFLFSLGISIWMDLAEKFPVNKIIDFQASIFDGGYYPKFTFFLTLMMVWLPLLAAEKIIVKVLRKK